MPRPFGLARSGSSTMTTAGSVDELPGEVETRDAAVTDVDEEPRLQEVLRRCWQRVPSAADFHPAVARRLFDPRVPDKALPAVLTGFRRRLVAGAEWDPAAEADASGHEQSTTESRLSGATSTNAARHERTCRPTGYRATRATSSSSKDSSTTTSSPHVAWATWPHSAAPRRALVFSNGSAASAWKPSSSASSTTTPAAPPPRRQSRTQCAPAGVP
jgi:hypothetical protein